ELAVNAFVVALVRRHEALDHDLRAGRHLQVHRFTLHQLDRLAADASRQLRLRYRRWNGRPGDDAGNRLCADSDSQRHGLVAGAVLLVVQGRAVLGGDGQPAERVAVMHLVAVHAPVDVPTVRVLGDVDVPRTDESPAI